MPLNYVIYLTDIIASIQEIQIYTDKVHSFDEYSKDRKTCRAVERNLEIIGEAVKKIPNTTKAAHPEIEWRKFAGLRDMLIHGYSEIDDEIIWEVVNEKIPNLLSTVTKILEHN